MIIKWYLNIKTCSSYGKPIVCDVFDTTYSFSATEIHWILVFLCTKYLFLVSHLFPAIHKIWVRLFINITNFFTIKSLKCTLMSTNKVNRYLRGTTVKRRHYLIHIIFLLPLCFPLTVISESHLMTADNNPVY